MVMLGLGGLPRSAWAAAQGLGISFRVLFVFAQIVTAGPLAHCDLHHLPRAPSHPTGLMAWPGGAASAARATLRPAVSTSLGGA